MRHSVCPFCVGKNNMKSYHKVLLCCFVAWFCCEVVECRGHLLDAEGNVLRQGNLADEGRPENGVIKATNIHGDIVMKSNLGVNTGDKDAIKIPDQVCKTDFPKCAATGGYCVVKVEEGEKSAVQCECPDKSVYEASEGCTVPDEMCKTYFPKCMETGGQCYVDFGNEEEQSVVLCECPEMKGYKEGVGCKACDCGISATGCSFVGDFKTCACLPNYGQKEDKCVDCECGKNSSGCIFTKSGQKFCKCNENFYRRGEECVVSDVLCESGFPYCTITGGYCNMKDEEESEKSAFECICADKSVYEENEGCKVPDKVCKTYFPKCMETGGKCNVDCYEDTGICCECPEMKEYKEGAGCQECDCGTNSISCKFVNDEKECYCFSNYAQKDEVCTECGCGYYSHGCEFEKGEKKCDCVSEYGQKDGVCIDNFSGIQIRWKL